MVLLPSFIPLRIRPGYQHVTHAPQAGTANPAPPVDAREMLARGFAFLQQKCDPEARLHAELLVAFALGLDRLHLFLELDRPVSPEEITRARDLLVRRGKGEPTAYLTGQREFYGRSFRVGSGVLVPRPETELLVDLARTALKECEAPRIAELGTGSGCIAVTLALELKDARICASDISPEALTFARSNAEDLEAAVTFLGGDGPEVFAYLAPFDLFVSNPPYVDPQDPDLEQHVREHEPDLALFSPAGDPDHWVRRLLEDGLGLLAPGGQLMIELGHDQGPRVAQLCQERGLGFRLECDLAGIERVLVVQPRP
ncbi:MAG: release factor glutamine methyltransferase [Planctomycetota bacterium]